jgi:hypothetical protein
MTNLEFFLGGLGFLSLSCRKKHGLILILMQCNTYLVSPVTIYNEVLKPGEHNADLKNGNEKRSMLVCVKDSCKRS